jgi:transposase
MEQLRSTEARDWREGRRLRAWDLHQQGWKQHEIATALGVTQGAVSQWLSRGKEGGAEALRRRKAPGAIPRLTLDQQARLPELLAGGAEAHGFRGEVWTCARVSEVIRWEFGVRYHPAHVSRLLKASRLSLQKPARRAGQRDEEAIEHWKEERWPSLKKGL